MRKALEDALGVRFEGEKGTRFFRSTPIQTLFCGLLRPGAAGKADPPPTGAFD